MRRLLRKRIVILGVLVAVALLAIACKDRIDKGLVQRADAATTTSTFGPVADAYVSASTPDTSYGATTQINADGDPAKISYLRFDVSGLPSDSTVISAKLRLYVNNATSDGPGARNINTTWNENTVTWNTRPSIDETAIVGDLGAITLGRWVEMDVTPMITGNGTFNIALTQPYTDGSGFHSREGANKPQLIVTTNDNVTPPPLPDTTAKIVATGDIASSGNLAASQATAKLVSARPDATVLAIGDLAYEAGTLTEFNNYYKPSWGAFKSRTNPVPGNHEYIGSTTKQYGAGYFNYFGAAAHKENAGSYSYDLGAWHIVALNTGQCYGALEADGTSPRCGPVDPMIVWLKNDLQAHTNMCTLAYFHHPRFSSSKNQPSALPWAKTLYRELYDGNADVILNGHSHNYERFAPMNPDGQIDDGRGIREFIVGTGGRSIHALGTKVAGSQVFYGGYGILEMSLGDQGYSWSFVPTSGTFTDSGSGTCH